MKILVMSEERRRVASRQGFVTLQNYSFCQKQIPVSDSSGLVTNGIGPSQRIRQNILM